MIRRHTEAPTLTDRINKLPKWARDYIHRVETFVGAPEVQELVYLRDQNRQLVKLVSELKMENRRLKAKASMPKPKGKRVRQRSE